MPADNCFGALFLHCDSPRQDIPGLIVAERAISSEEELAFLCAVDASEVPWTQRRTRITKNYGPYYLYNERDTPEGRFRYTDGKILHTPLPSFLHQLILPIITRAVPQLARFTPNQFHVSLYLQSDDHKIHMHNDNKMGELGPFIVGICLKSDAYMTFVRPSDGKRKLVHLPRKCVYVMTGESHTEWRHGILTGHTKSDRVSFTLRDVRKLAVEEGVKVTKSKHMPSEIAIAKQREKDSVTSESRVQALDIKLVK